MCLVKICNENEGKIQQIIFKLSERERWRYRERDKMTETERKKERERQTERETDRERDRQRYRERDRHENIQWAKCLLILGDNNEKNLEKNQYHLFEVQFKKIEEKIMSAIRRLFVFCFFHGPSCKYDPAITQMER